MKPTGGGLQKTPVAPPAPLWPGFNQGLMGKGQGKELGGDLFTSLHDITSGLDVSKIFQSITDANKRMTSEGVANLDEQFGASGTRGGGDAMRAVTDYQLQSQKDLQAQLGSMSFDAEKLKLGGDSMLMQFATAFAPTEALSQKPAGQSIFSQVASAGEAAMMLFLAASTGGAAAPLAAGI